jgi:hypothetical protein
MRQLAKVKALPLESADSAGAGHEDENTPLPFDLPAVARKKVSAAFLGGRITSDGGVMLLAQAAADGFHVDLRGVCKSNALLTLTEGFSPGLGYMLGWGNIRVNSGSRSPSPSVWL